MDNFGLNASTSRIHDFIQLQHDNPDSQYAEKHFKRDHKCPVGQFIEKAFPHIDTRYHCKDQIHDDVSVGQDIYAD